MALAVAEWHVEATWPGFCYQPTRWRTADGFVGFRRLWVQWRILQAIWALTRLNAAQGHALTHSGDRAETAVKAELDAAFPDP